MAIDNSQYAADSRLRSHSPLQRKGQGEKSIREEKAVIAQNTRSHSE